MSWYIRKTSLFYSRTQWLWSSSWCWLCRPPLKEVGYVFRSSIMINELVYQKDFPLPLKDQEALLIQLVLTLPATIERGRLCIQKLYRLMSWYIRKMFLFYSRTQWLCSSSWCWLWRPPLKEVGYVFRSSNMINELVYQKDVSLLLKDPVALLIQLVLTLPATIIRGMLCIQKL